MTTRRAYAASLGLAKADGRGRLSAAALAAIEEMEANGMVFEDSAAAKERSVKAKEPKTVVKAGAFDAKKVRAWAQSMGLTVNSRGRLSAEIMDAYSKANPDVKPSETREHIRVVGKDIRPTAPRTRSNRTEYVAYFGEKRIMLNEREACKCGYSLSHCSCGSPIVLGMDVTVRSRG